MPVLYVNVAQRCRREPWRAMTVRRHDIRCVFGHLHHADLQQHLDRGALQIDRLLDFSAKTGDQILHFRVAGLAFDEREKIVALDTAERMGRAAGDLEPPGHRLEYLVAEAVTEGAVDA
jgi:hypothetical protein